MDEVVLMAIAHTLDDLFEEYLGGLLIQPPLLLHEFEQFPPLEELHDDGYFHVPEGEAVVDLDDVVVVE